jgi:hypothetical protein
VVYALLIALSSCCLAWSVDEPELGGAIIMVFAMGLYGIVVLGGIVVAGIVNGLLTTSLFRDGRWSAFQAGDMAAASYGCPAQRYGSVVAASLALWVLVGAAAIFRVLLLCMRK